MSLAFHWFLPSYGDSRNLVAGGKPWLACGYLVATAVISVLATALIRDRDLHF